MPAGRTAPCSTFRSSVGRGSRAGGVGRHRATDAAAADGPDAGADMRAARRFERPPAFGSDPLEPWRGPLRRDERPLRGYRGSHSCRPARLRGGGFERRHLDHRAAGTRLAPGPRRPHGHRRPCAARLFRFRAGRNCRHALPRGQARLYRRARLRDPAAPAAPHLWALLARRARPAGFAAADMLRIEAGFVLFANEFCLPVTAREAGLERFTGACARQRRRRRRSRWSAFRPTHPRSGAVAAANAARSSSEVGNDHRHFGLSLAGRWHAGAGLCVAVRCDGGRAAVCPAGAFADIRLAPLPFFDRDKRRPKVPWAAPAQGR